MTVVKIVVEIEGLEPSLTEPESVVLPLHHISIWPPILILGLQRYECFLNLQNILRFFADFCLNWTNNHNGGIAQLVRAHDS